MARGTKGTQAVEGGVAWKRLEPGWHICWQQRTYRLVGSDPNNPLLLSVVDVVTSELGELSYADLVLAEPTAAEQGQAGEHALFAPTREALEAAVADRARVVEAQPVPKPTTSNKRFDKLASRAAAIIAMVRAVDESVAEKRRVATLRGEKFQYTAALTDSCKHVEAAKDGSLSKTTYYEYRRLCQKNGWDALRLAAAMRRKSFNASTLDPAAIHLADTMLVKYFGRNRSMSASFVYEAFLKGTLSRTGGLWPSPALCEGGTVPQDLVDRLLKPSIPMDAILANPESRAVLAPIDKPSRSWFMGHARWLAGQPDEGRKLLISRYGQQWWEAERMVFDDFAARAQTSLEFVFGDHHLLDTYAVDGETRSSPERLWLTMFIDAFSRAILGFVLLYEDPCIESIQQGLLHSIWPKTSHTALGLSEDYTVFGIPGMLMLDNAWAHHSHSLESLARQLSQGGHYPQMAIDYRVPYMARRGALIERLFGTLTPQIRALLPGAMQGSGLQAAHSAKQRACYLYEDLYRAIHQLVLRYQHTPHSALGGLTPNQKFLEGISARPPLVPPLTDSTRRLFWRLYPETRQLTQKGISLWGMHYWSAELSWAESVGRDGSPIEYEIRYDPTNIGKIVLYRGGVWVCDAYAKELRQADGTTRVVSMVERMLARRLTVQAGDSTANWLEYVAEIDATTKQREREKRRARAIQGEAEAAPSAGQPVRARLRSITADASRADRELRRLSQSQGGTPSHTTAANKEAAPEGTQPSLEAENPRLNDLESARAASLRRFVSGQRPYGALQDEAEGTDYTNRGEIAG